jgi:hypothetical protein
MPRRPFSFGSLFTHSQDNDPMPDDPASDIPSDDNDDGIVIGGPAEPPIVLPPNGGPNIPPNLPSPPIDIVDIEDSPPPDDIITNSGEGDRDENLPLDTPSDAWQVGSPITPGSFASTRNFGLGIRPFARTSRAQTLQNRKPTSIADSRNNRNDFNNDRIDQDQLRRRLRNRG